MDEKSSLIFWRKCYTVPFLPLMPDIIIKLPPMKYSTTIMIIIQNTLKVERCRLISILRDVETKKVCTNEGYFGI